MNSEARMAATSTGLRPPELIDDSAKQSQRKEVWSLMFDV